MSSQRIAQSSPGDPEEGRGVLPRAVEGRPPPKPRLYRENFTPEECQELDRNEILSAVSELCILRILLARVLRALRKIKPTLEHHYKNLVIFSQVGVTMASLARFQHRRDGPPPDPFLDALAQMADDPL